MITMNCPNCDGPLDVPSQRSTIVCMYCGTTVQVHTGEIFKEHYIMKVQYSDEQASAKMLSWAMKQLGAPKDLEDNASIKDAKLTFWPFWVVEVEADAEYTGTQKKPKFGKDGVASKLRSEDIEESGHIESERDIAMSATTRMPSPLARYIIPTKRKEFFSKDLVLEVGASIEQADIERESAIHSAQEEMKHYIHMETIREVDKISKMNANLETPSVFLIHVPIWEIKYRYRIRSYTAHVDGASGRVISMNFPRKMAFRAMTLFGGLLHLGIGGGIGLVLVYLGLLSSDQLFPTLFGIVFGLGMLAISIQYLAKAISLRSEEESPE